MRISDWSSDVCSSDLPDCTIGRQRVLDIAKGDQDGPVVIDQRRIGASIGDADLRAQTRPVEHTLIEAGAASKSDRTARDPRFKPASAEPNEAGQENRRKQVGLGDAPPCRAGGECARGGAATRPPPKQA